MPRFRKEVGRHLYTEGNKENCSNTKSFQAKILTYKKFNYKA